MTLHSHTEPGGKAVNEDYVIARRHPLSDGGYVCLLADGQGGRSHGAEAAKAACESAWKLASATPFDQLCRDGGWAKILQPTDVEVSATGGYTTLIAVAIDRDFASGASSGDSKAYFMCSEGGEMAEWTHAQRKNPPVGSGEADFMPFMCHAVGGGRLLILSDGVWKYCGYDALREAFDSPIAGIPAQLKDAILQRSGRTLPDDLSVVAVDVG